MRRICTGCSSSGTRDTPPRVLFQREMLLPLPFSGEASHYVLQQSEENAMDFTRLRSEEK